MAHGGAKAEVKNGVRTVELSNGTAAFADDDGNLVLTNGDGSQFGHVKSKKTKWWKRVTED